MSRALALLTALGITTVAAGCGGQDFQDKPSPAAPVQLSGVIKSSRVTVSPSKVGAGPIQITISNQTTQAHTVTLEGDRVREQLPPIQPEDTATLQKTLGPGTYQVRAGSPVATSHAIEPARLRIGRARRDSNGDLLQP